jgi:D-alanyl-D-alanine carboxypeptidase
LGLQESHFVNPNGLHDATHYSSARDMAMIARALLRDFPEHADLFDIGAIQLGDQIINNHNGLLGHYPGADGMKTGFTCAAGFNVVASATRNGRKLIVVVFGSPSARERNLEAAQLFDRGFAQSGGGPALDGLPRSAQTAPQDQRGEICSRRNRAAIAAAEEEVFGAPAVVSTPAGRGATFVTASAAEPVQTSLSNEPVHFDPVPVFVGAKEGWTGPVLAARPSPNTPADAAAYTGDKAQGAGEAAGDVSAPMALEGAVKPAASVLAPAKAQDNAKPTRMAVVIRQHRVRHFVLARKPKPVAEAHP